jgi:hypothetical protein
MKIINSIPKPCSPGESSNSPKTIAKIPKRIPKTIATIFTS